MREKKLNKISKKTNNNNIINKLKCVIYKKLKNIITNNNGCVSRYLASVNY